MFTWLTILFLIGFAIVRWRRNSSGPWYSLGKYTGFGLTLLLSLSAAALVNVLYKQGGGEGKTKFEKARTKIYEVYNSTEKEAKSHPELAEAQFSYVKAAADAFFESGDTAYLAGAEKYYMGVLDSEKSEQVKNASRIGIAYALISEGRGLNAKLALMTMTDTNVKFYNYFLARIAWEGEEKQKAVKYASQEMSRTNGYKEGAVKLLAEIYELKGDDNELGTLIDETPDKSWIDISLRESYYKRTGHYLAYTILTFEKLINAVGYIAVIGAVLVLILWINFLLKLDFGNKTRWGLLILSVLGGMASIFLALYLYPLMQKLLNVQMRGDFKNNIIYSFAVIGPVEEFSKIIPFIIVLLFAGRRLQPIDYIIYASSTALGFAFIENIEYFSNNAATVIIFRAILAAVAHMIFTSVIAYALVLSRFKRGGMVLVYFIPAFILASALHGMYDFWIINQGHRFALISLVVWVFSVNLFVLCINNAMNNSAYTHDTDKFDQDTIINFLLSGLIGLAAVEYLLNVFHNGPEETNKHFTEALVGFVILLVFISRRLANIDIVRNEWQPITLRSIWGGTFSQITRNYNQIIGEEIELRPLRQESVLNDFLPQKGIIQKRVRIADSNRGYLVKLEKPLVISEVVHPYIYIKPKDENTTIEPGQNQVVYLLTALDTEDYEQTSIPDGVKYVDWAIVR